jgi:AraC family transcriptional regulator
MPDTEPHSPATPSPPRAVARALSYVDAHLCEPLTAQALAVHAASSPHHFHRLFAAHMGCSVGDYITWRRLHRAAALLVSGRESVLQIALEVGFESGQSLAKTMRRLWNTTPSAVRRGQAHPHILIDTPWHQGRGPLPTRQTSLEIPMVTLTRHAHLPSGLMALTATARGMVNHTLQRSAQLAFGELTQAVQAAGLWGQAWSWVAICPDDAQGPDDPHCRYVAGVIFGYAMHVDQGQCVQPQLPLSGTLAWQPVAAGRYAVFTHRGSYATLYLTWASIYRDWVPASGETLRDEPPLELMLNSPANTREEDLLTEIWIPVA